MHCLDDIGNAIRRIRRVRCGDVVEESVEVFQDFRSEEDPGQRRCPLVRVSLPWPRLGCPLALGTRFPVGVVTGVLGAPYLIYLIVRTNRAGSSL